jgi:hypothetical protein
MPREPCGNNPNSIIANFVLAARAAISKALERFDPRVDFKCLRPKPSSIDQMSSRLTFGSALSLPVGTVLQLDYLLANSFVAHGSPIPFS